MRMALALRASSTSSVVAAAAAAAAASSSSSSSSSASFPLRRRRAAGAMTTRAVAVAAAPIAERRRVVPTGKRSVAETFSRLREQGKTAFIPYITAGDPDLATTSAALKVLDSCGADVIELGLPYSDPLADGPIIRASASRALKKGATLDSVMAMLKGTIPELSCPVVIFTYYNPILKRGARNFMATIKQAGVHGLIVPDLPLEEARLLRNEAIMHNIELVLLTTPTTPTERTKEIADASEGFVYLVSVSGVTGPRPEVNPRVKDLIQKTKQVTEKAVAVGFGISTPDHVRQIAEWGADGVIIGSAMVRQLGEAASPKEGLKRLAEYARSLKNALP